MANNIEKQQISIKAIFCRDQKFLFLKQPNGFWEMPGGRLELGEDIKACFA